MMPFSYYSELEFPTLDKAQEAHQWIRSHLILDDRVGVNCRNFTLSGKVFVEFYTKERVFDWLISTIRKECHPMWEKLNETRYVLTSEMRDEYAKGQTTFYKFLKDLSQAHTLDLRAAIIRLESPDSRLRDLYHDSEEKIAQDRGYLDLLNELVKHAEEYLKGGTSSGK